jgi:hypothetical protein
VYVEEADVALVAEGGISIAVAVSAGVAGKWEEGNSEREVEVEGVVMQGGE